MKNIKKLLAIICLFSVLLTGFVINEEPKEVKAMSVTDFLNTVGPMATADMQRTGILASLTMAQAILESGWGTSTLATNANALFGMKATNWSGPTYWYNGTSWRAYGSWQESVNDHGNHLSTMSRYSNLVGETNYITACYNVAADGYCPDEGYAERLIELIERYDLTQFDVYSSLTLEGHGAVNLGESFYAYIRQEATGLYLTDRDYNVFAAEATNGSDQLWHFVRQTNGAYSISMDNSGCYMDVTAGNYDHGTNIQTHVGNGSLAQKFFVYYISGGFYFKCTASDLLFDVDASSKNLQIHGTETFYEEPERMENIAKKFEIISPCLSDGTWNTNYGNNFTAYIRNLSSGNLLTVKDGGVVGAEPKFEDNQKWKIEMNKYGGYEIKSALTGEALDIQGASVDSGAIVQLYQANHSKAQTFFFIKRHGGLYIKPSYSNLVLDMDVSTGALHTYGWLDAEHQMNAQLFEVIIEKSYDGDSPVYFGDSFDAYMISKYCGRAVTDVEIAPSCQAVSYGQNQLWHFEYDEKWNAYKITGSSGKVIDVAGAGWSNGTELCMWESNDSPAQRFRIYVSDGGYFISPACTSKIVDVDTNTETKVQLWDAFVGDSRKFDIIKITKDGEKPLNLGSTFESPIKNIASSLYMNPADASIKCTTNENIWVFTRQSTGAYTIKDKKTGKVLDVQTGNVVPGTRLQTYEYNGTWAQNFFIYKHGNGYILQPANFHGAVDMNATTKEVHIYGITNDTNDVKAQTFDFPGLSSGIKPNSSSGYAVKGDYIVSVAPNTSVSVFLSRFTNSGLSVYDKSGAVISGSKYVSTGYTVRSTSGEIKVIVVMGDIDGDGKVSTTDSIRTKRFMLGLETVTEISKHAIDFDENGIIDTTDYLRLRELMIG